MTVKTLEPRVKEGKLVQGVGQFPFGIARSQKYSQKFFESKTEILRFIAYVVT